MDKNLDTFLFKSLGMGTPLSLEQRFPELTSAEFELRDVFMKRDPSDESGAC